jgi:hypothetical protein
MSDVRVSPRAFDLVQRELKRMRSEGYDEYAATRYALSRIGLWPESFTETNLIVDYALTSVVYPFMTRCSADDEYEAITGL